MKLRAAARHGERGAVIVEFALCATVALTLMFGILDFGRALYTYHLVANAARIGARYAIVHGSDCTTAGCPATPATIQTYVRSLSPAITTANLTVTAAWSLTTICFTAKAGGCNVAVTASYPFAFAILPRRSITMTSTSTMAISE